jgi:DNA repair ATPase RecN
LDSTIIVALIAAAASILTGIITLVGVILTNRQQARDIDHKLETQQAVINTKLDELTREVREHNNFARRMPVVEEQIKVVNHRLEDLEGFHKPHN